MWCQDGLRRDAVIAEKPIRSFELGIVQRLRETLARSLGQLVGQKTQTPIQPLVTKVRLAQLS